MVQDINKPTGLGYQGTWTRKCTMCGHGDLQHFGKMGCLVVVGPAGVLQQEIQCSCRGFAARDLSYEELEIIRNPPKSDDTKYLGEVFDSDLQDEIRRQRGAPIMKLPQTDNKPTREALEWRSR